MSIALAISLAAALLAATHLIPTANQDCTCTASGTLNDGKTFSGTLPAAGKWIVATSTDDEDVKIPVISNPPWASTDVVLEVQWDVPAKLYVIRGISWTGEAKRIAGSATTTLPGGGKSSVSLERVRQLSIRCPKQSK